MFHGHIVTQSTPNNSIPMNGSQTPSTQSLMSMSSPQSMQSMHSLNCTPQSIKSTPGTIILEEERPGTEEEWKLAWCNWAFSRKRGKLAQFIIRHLQLGDYTRWLEAKRGKFEIRDWQTLAKIWYLEKERTSEEMDATSIFKKGLSKAFPNLQEVKHMSIKEGTLYKTRVFEAPKELCDEVYKFVKNPRTPAIPFECAVLYPGNANPTLLEHYQQNNQFASTMFPIGPNNNQVFDLSFPHITTKREQAFQQPIHPTFHHSIPINQQQQQIPLRIFPRAVPHQVHPSQIINQQTTYVTQQPEYTLHPISQQLLNGNMVPSNTVYTLRDPDQVVPENSFSPESTSFYSQVETDPNNQQYAPHAQCDIEEYVDIPCKPSPGSDHLTMVPSPHVQAPFDENVPSNMYTTSSSYTQRSPSGHMESPLVDQKDVEHARQQVQEQSHIMPIDFYEVRVTPVHSPIQGGGDLCLVFSQQDHPVPRGEKFLYFDSAIAPHLVAINQDMGYALFTQIPAHPRSETLRIYVMEAETRAKIASAEFTYTDSSYSPYTIEVLKGLTQNLISNEQYKSITGDFSNNQFHNAQQQTPNQFYNHPGYNPMYKMLVLAAGLGLEPLLYVLLQPRTHHNLLLIPSPAGLLPEDYAQKFGHYKISVCLSLVRKQYEHTSGVQNDETEDGEVETTKRDNKSSFYPKGDPLELINRGGTTPIETTQAIMTYLTKLMTPVQLQLQPIPSPPTTVSTSPPVDKKTITKACSEDVLTKKSSVGKLDAEKEPSPKPYDRGHSTPKLGKSSSKSSSSSNVLGDSGYEPSFESFRESRDGGDVITGEINLISGLKYSRKCDLGSINSINHHKVDRMLEKDAIDLLNQELKGLRMEGKPMVLTARGEFEATLKLEPLQSIQDLQKVFDSREVKITKSDESSFTIVGGNQTGIFIHSIKNPIENHLAPGDQILALNGDSFLRITGFEAYEKIASFSKNQVLNFTVAHNQYRYSKTLSHSDSWDSIYVRTNFYFGTPATGNECVWRVVNSLYTPDSWRAWKDGEQGRDTDIAEIPSPDRVQRMKYDVIVKGFPHFIYLTKNQVPRARPIVLMGPGAEGIRDKLVSIHSDKFADFEREDSFKNSLNRNTRHHPVIVLQTDRHLLNISYLHPIAIMCGSTPSVLPNIHHHLIYPETEPTKDTIVAPQEIVNLDGSSLENYCLQAISSISRDNEFPASTIHN